MINPINRTPPKGRDYSSGPDPPKKIGDPSLEEVRQHRFFAHQTAERQNLLREVQAITDPLETTSEIKNIVMRTFKLLRSLDEYVTFPSGAPLEALEFAKHLEQKIYNEIEAALSIRDNPGELRNKLGDTAVEIEKALEAYEGPVGFFREALLNRYSGDTFHIVPPFFALPDLYFFPQAPLAVPHIVAAIQSQEPTKAQLDVVILTPVFFADEELLKGCRIHHKENEATHNNINLILATLDEVEESVLVESVAKMMKRPLTLLLDATQKPIESLRKLLENKQILGWINDGMLNLVILRDAAFDEEVLSFDELHNGVALCFNEESAFENFNLYLETSYHPSLQLPIGTDFVDKDGLLIKHATRVAIGKKLPTRIRNHHRDWYLNQAILYEHINKTSDPNVKEKLIKLALATKVAVIEDNTPFELQASPLYPAERLYHRSTENLFLDQVHKVFAERMLDLKPEHFLLVDSPLIKEIIQRTIAQNNPYVELADLQQLDDEKLIEMLNQSKSAARLNAPILDISKLLAKRKKMHPKESLGASLNFVIDAVAFCLDNIHELEPVAISRIIVIGFVQVKGQTVLIFSDPKQKGRFEELLILHGYRLTPEGGKQALLRANSSPTGFTPAYLGTKGSVIPQVVASWHDFLTQPAVEHFCALGKNEAPYLKIIPQATYELLKGIESECPNIDKELEEKGLRDLVQISYFRILHAMQTAVHKKDDLTEFINQIDLIHQQLQNILILLSPHDKTALEKAVVSHLTLQKNIPTPRVHLKASAMRCLSSVISAVHAEKQSPHLGILFLKDTYYEATAQINASHFYKRYQFSGDAFNDQGLRAAITRKGAVTAPQKGEIDLFLCEFHHNISEERKIYKPEKIAQQLKALVRQGYMAPKFTVAVDTTISLQSSIDEFLFDPMIQNLIQTGRLNLVFFRSAQKFDMLGQDNYYGGLTLSFNDGHSFESFTQRMDHPDDQLQGANYQGITHLQKYGFDSIQSYKSAVMKNNQLLHRSIPKQLLYSDNNTLPFVISRVEDEQVIHLSLTLNSKYFTALLAKPNLDLLTSVGTAFVKWAQAHSTPLTQRSSFGFINTNTSYPGDALRVNIGLESRETVLMYADFFQKLYDQLQIANKEISSALANHTLDHKILNEYIDYLIEQIG